MEQDSMYFTWEEALAADVMALGGRKKLAPRLWPSENEETAQERLKAALSPGHKLELKPAEVLKIKEWARDVGSESLMRFESQLLSFRYDWIDPVDESTQLRREVRDVLQDVTRKLDRIERAEQRVSLRVAK